MPHGTNNNHNNMNIIWKNMSRGESKMYATTRMQVCACLHVALVSYRVATSGGGGGEDG